MTTATIPQTAFGLSWALPYGKELLTKSLAPSFVFVDFETFANTNVAHRLSKRGISAYVSINAPLQLLTSLYGWDEAVSIASGTGQTRALDQAVEYVERSMRAAAEAGASAVVLCDDLCGTSNPQPSPLFVVGSLVPLYQRFGRIARSAGIPLIFHSEGDIHEYYSAFAESGYAGVHIAHPTFEQTAELFAAAREHGLTPIGGIVCSQLLKGKTDEAVEFAANLCAGGPALICDDGRATSEDEMRQVIDAMAAVRTRVEGTTPMLS